MWCISREIPKLADLLLLRCAFGVTHIILVPFTQFWFLQLAILHAAKPFHICMYHLILSILLLVAALVFLTQCTSTPSGTIDEDVDAGVADVEDVWDEIFLHNGHIGIGVLEALPLLRYGFWAEMVWLLVVVFVKAAWGTHLFFGELVLHTVILKGATASIVIVIVNCVIKFLLIRRAFQILPTSIAETGQLPLCCSRETSLPLLSDVYILYFPHDLIIQMCQILGYCGNRIVDCQ